MDEVIFRTDWITVRKSPQGFQYLERKGKDSVAVFLLRRVDGVLEGWEVLVCHQHLCLDNRQVNGHFRLFPCPVTGALDEGEFPEAAARREVYEETGYRIKSIASLGQYIVGTQVNEVCYLFFADVTGDVPDEGDHGLTYLESVAQLAWHPLEYLQACDYVACQIGYFKLVEALAESEME
ncbi:MAG: NUDIX domain-containing protein [Cyanobacteria bacterium P01_A01_bin.135]